MAVGSGRAEASSFLTRPRKVPQEPNPLRRLSDDFRTLGCLDTGRPLLLRRLRSYRSWTSRRSLTFLDFTAFSDLPVPPDSPIRRLRFLSPQSSPRKILSHNAFGCTQNTVVLFSLACLANIPAVQVFCF